ncbi:hypothetical protein GGR53DRAFT_532275 [Hypoxylon sp. FL1150]|nr:hypothetical protein GGR53DRAFT_532275 [Hypoxylon sp. FL1150]
MSSLATEEGQLIVQPLYDPGQSRFLSGQGGAELTDSPAQQAGEAETQNVIYPGSLILRTNEV